MALKRKRSVDESPISVSSFGSVATPEAQSPTPIPIQYDSAMDLDATSHRGLGLGWNFSSVGRVKGGDWGLRTRKRFRDNRPDERVIHGMLRNATLSEVIQTDFPRKHYKQALLRPAQASSRRTHYVGGPPISTGCACSPEAAEVDITFFLEITSTACPGSSHSNAAPTCCRYSAL